MFRPYIPAATPCRTLTNNSWLKVNKTGNLSLMDPKLSTIHMMQKANVFSRWISSANCAHSITMSKEAFLRTCLAIRSDMQASSLLGSLTRPTKFRLRSSSSHNMLRCSTHHTVSTAPSYGLAECMRRVPSWQLKTPFSDQWSAPGKWVMGRKLLGAIAWSLTLQQCMPLRWVKVFGTRKSTDFCPLITPKCEGNKDAKSGILPYCKHCKEQPFSWS